MSLPAIKLLTEGEVARYLHMANGDVQELVPKQWGFDRPGWQATQDTIYRLNNYDVFSKVGQVCHPTEAYLRLVGQPEVVQSGPVKPEIHYTLQAWQPKYDYVISMHTAVDGGRVWPQKHWETLIKELSARGTVAIVGQWKYGINHNIDADLYYDKPINDVCGVLAKAGTVITIDNGIARLKHAIGGKHIQIASDVVPKVWVEYPGCDLLYGDIRKISPEDVLQCI